MSGVVYLFVLKINSNRSKQTEMKRLEVTVKTVTSPFSFFCLANADDFQQSKDIQINDVKELNTKRELALTISDTNHGQYVAVMYNNNWVRGIVSMESQFLIWLVDHGIYMQPTEATVYVNLPAVYKKLPSRIFEASIHGVTPVGIVLNELYEFKNEPKLSWGLGAIEKAQELIACAAKTYFAPIAMVTTKNNDVVLGDLYLEYKDKGIVNLIDEMEDAPMFLERSQEIYLKNISSFYTSRRHNHACLLKPELSTKNLPTITAETTLTEYSAICDQITPYSRKFDCESEDGSSVSYIENVGDVPNRNSLKLTPNEIEQYANEYIVIGGKEVCVLTILINKARDLYLCERDKRATKSVGRAYTRMKAI